MKPYLLAASNWKSIKEQEIELVVLPWGATEAHNFHLPYATDTIEADAIAQRSAAYAWEKGAKVMVLPTIPFGVNTGQADIRLDINLNPSTQTAIINDIVDVLNRQKIFKLLILNSHGGNDFKAILREVGYHYPEMLLFTCNWFQSGEESRYFEEPGDHAGEMETSLIMHLRPELVRPLAEAGTGKAKKFTVEALNQSWAWTERKWSRVTQDTGVGNPVHASAAKGEKYLQHISEKVGNLMIDLAKTSTDNLYR
jgi:creatinine amidohydrolase